MTPFRLLQVAAAMLYAGPLLAGIAGYGPLMLLPFLALFMLWQVRAAPGHWPAYPRDWIGREAQLPLLTLIASQLLFVTLLFATARGMGGVIGATSGAHPLLPLVLSLLALPLQSRALADRDAARQVKLRVRG